MMIKENLLIEERALWNQGFQLVAGVDEAGRGPLAGPVVAAAVIFPPEQAPVPHINDSTRLSVRARLAARDLIHQKALAIGIGIVEPKKIDEINILQATHAAMQLAVKNLRHVPDFVLVDGRTVPKIDVPCRPLIKGDSRSISIAAASIIAKITRDQIMIEYDRKYPQWGFARHKGYPTQVHLQAIRTNGLSPIHRRSFRPKKLLDIYEILS